MLENITKPLWHVLPPDGRTVWRKCPVCSYKNACLRNYYKSHINKHVYLNPQPIVEFWRCDVTDFKVGKKISAVLENIAKTALCFLPQGCTIACRKWRVCTDLKIAHAFLWDWRVNMFLSNRKAIVDFLCCDERSHNLITVLQNIANPTWYIFPPSGTTACRKCPVHS